MEKIKLTSAEFLSIYTGVLMGDKFDIVIDGIEKLYDGRPLDATLIDCANQFRKYVNNKRKDLVTVMKKIGRPIKSPERNLGQQVDEYILKFENEFGAKEIEIDKTKFKAFTMGREF